MALRKTQAMLDIERVHENKPIEEIIIDLYDQLGNSRLVADELGISRHTLSIWCFRLDINVRVRATSGRETVSLKAS